MRKIMRAHNRIIQRSLLNTDGRADTTDCRILPANAIGKINICRSNNRQLTHSPPFFLHTKTYSLLQGRSSNLPVLAVRKQYVLLLSGLFPCHRRKLDVLPSSQYWADGEGSTLDSEYLYRPIQPTEEALHIETVNVVCSAYKKLSYRRGTARCIVSSELLPVATQQCRNYLYDKS